jgi:hypothetical protein
MLAIDVTDSDLMLVMPHGHGGVAGMLVALEDAGLGVSRKTLTDVGSLRTRFGRRSA